jgi:hypothetical protein
VNALVSSQLCQTCSIKLTPCQSATHPPWNHLLESSSLSPLRCVHIHLCFSTNLAHGGHENSIQQQSHRIRQRQQPQGKPPHVRHESNHGRQSPMNCFTGNVGAELLHAFTGLDCQEAKDLVMILHAGQGHVRKRRPNWGSQPTSWRAKQLAWKQLAFAWRRSTATRNNR